MKEILLGILSGLLFFLIGIPLFLVFVIKFGSVMETTWMFIFKLFGL